MNHIGSKRAVTSLHPLSGSSALTGSPGEGGQAGVPDCAGPGARRGSWNCRTCLDVCSGSLVLLGEIWLEDVAAWDEAQLPKDPTFQIMPGLMSYPARVSSSLAMTQSPEALG